ncbi:YcxB family protein [Alkalibaculum sporogenes]|uniref:YcxB family protein n=1 Tax=Alkalibaculum sporogenes TaxID=2655001 RepID=UPI001FE59FD0|nr:YcxB family protein [Alkalibaculum sporogenes]
MLRYAVPLLFSVPIYAIGTSLFRQPQIYWLAIAILFVIIWMISYPKQYIKLIKRTTKKLLQEGDNSSIFGEKTLLIDEYNITVKGEHTTETISRESIKSVKVYDDMILLYLSGISAQIIPTRYLNAQSKKSLMDELDVFIDVSFK